MKHNERARVAPLDFLKILLVHRKNATRTPRARPLAWCLVRLLAVIGLLWVAGLVFGSLARCDRPFMGSLAPFALILVLAL